MEGFIIAGFGFLGLVCSAVTGSRALDKLQNAPRLTSASPDGQFGHVYGELTSETPTPFDGVNYVNVLEQMYERYTKKTVVSIGHEMAGKSRVSFDLLTTTKIRCKDLSIGGLSVMSLINSFDRVDISEKYEPIQSFGSGGGNVSIVKVDNSKANPILGDHDRETLGHKTIVSGVPIGGFYTVFGTKFGSTVVHIGNENDRIVPNMTPEQVIEDQREWNNTFMCLWVVTTGVGCAISALQFASRQ